MVRRIPVMVLGRSAAQALRSEPAWEVCAVFSRSFYCRGAGGALVCLGPVALGAGPLNAVCLLPEGIAWDAEQVSPGDSAGCDGTTLWVADRFVFLLGGAEVWPPAPLAVPAQLAALGQSVARLVDSVRAWPRRDGFQALILGLTAGLERERAAETPLIRMALPAITRLARWLEESLAGPLRMAPSPLPDIEGLIGLGPGLTPSGDDFLGGVLVALSTFGYSLQAKWLGREVLDCAGRRTNAISYAHLACAAGGEGSAALHEMLETLAAPGAPELRDRLRAIDAIGHTSGWDALAGATLALAAVARAGRT